MMQTLDHPVITLNRVRIGNIVLGRMKVGDYRELEKEEIDALKKICLENKKNKRKNNE